MRTAMVVLLLAGAARLEAHPAGIFGTPGEVISVSVEVDGVKTPLYPAPDGSGRYYVEARQGRRYAVTVANRSTGRLGIALSVDGLDVISGERAVGPGRLYVLAPAKSTTVRGWRTSLEEVREFTFVDERVSYAVRSGKANRKMGWIELRVYRERAAAVALQDDEVESAASPVVGGSVSQRSPAARASEAERSSPGRSYPGTGWGRSTHDRVVLVDFEPESRPCESVTLRYEYAPALVALGVLTRPQKALDRLRERERAESGFAEPPLW